MKQNNCKDKYKSQHILVTLSSNTDYARKSNNYQENRYPQKHAFFSGIQNGSGYQPMFCVFKEVRQLLLYAADVEVNRRQSCMFCVIVCELRRFGSNSLCFALNTTSFPLPGWIGYTIISLIVKCSERIAVCL